MACSSASVRAVGEVGAVEIDIGRAFLPVGPDDTRVTQPRDSPLPYGMCSNDGPAAPSARRDHRPHACPGHPAICGRHDMGGTGEFDLAGRLAIGARGSDPQLDRTGLDDAHAARDR